MTVHERLALAAGILATIPTHQPEQLSLEQRALLATAHAQVAAAQVAVLRACREGWLTP